MRAQSLLLACILLTGCDAPRDDVRPPPEASPSMQKSIMRPDVEVPEPTATPLAPLAITIRFDASSDALSPEAVEALENMLQSPQLAAGGAIRLEGHSDAGGSDTANLAVSRKRAELVRDWLVEHGVAEPRISVIAFGEQNPVAANALPNGEPDEAGRSANRRVEIRIGVPQEPAVPAQSETLVEELSKEAD